MKKIAIGLIIFCLLIITVNHVCSADKENEVKGHIIKVDKSAKDWVGVPPVKENSWTISKGEYIFRDAKKDDVGAGQYEYPTNAAFGRCADLREFRVTCDDKNLYMLIRFNAPNEWWAPFCVIGIDRDGAYGKTGRYQVLAQGGLDYIDPDDGVYAELKVAPELSCGRVVAIYSCFRGRIWDAKGKLLARKQGEDNDTEGFLIDDDNVSTIEVAIPFEIIGDPRGRIWRFVVATGLEDGGHIREMAKETSEWRGGGGIGDGDEGEADPDVYDLASRSSELQIKELSSYKKHAPKGDPDAFVTIEKSYLTVRFAK
jgi:hypothetical protein